MIKGHLVIFPAMLSKKEMSYFSKSKQWLHIGKGELKVSQQFHTLLKFWLIPGKKQAKL